MSAALSDGCHPETGQHEPGSGGNGASLLDRGT